MSLSDHSGIERERKYLVSDAELLTGLPVTRIVQGYLVIGSGVEVRVRTGASGQSLTVKGERTGIERAEQEFIFHDRQLAFRLLEACDGRVIVKSRYFTDIAADDGHVDHWIIDEYHADNDGLVIAEYEYPEPGDLERELPLPDWVGPEVTHLDRYYAQNLSIHPYREWSEGEREV